MFTILFILNWGLIYSPKKEEATERSDVDFEIGDLGTLAHVYVVWKKLLQSLLVFLLLSKVLFTSIPFLLDSLDLPIYGWKSSKRYKIMQLFMFLEEGFWKLLWLVRCRWIIWGRVWLGRDKSRRNYENWLQNELHWKQFSRILPIL